MAETRTYSKIIAFIILIAIPVAGVIYLKTNYEENRETIKIITSEYVRLEEPMTYYGPYSLDTIYTAGDSIAVDSIPYTLPYFKFISHTGDSISSDWVEDKIYVVDFIFTRCPSICPVMTSWSSVIQKQFAKKKEVKLITFTVDPEHDSVEVLKAFAERYDNDPEKWRLLTGSKEDIYDLAINAFRLVTSDEGFDFIHSPKMILIDQENHIRGYYDGTDTTEVRFLMQDINRLIDPLKPRINVFTDLQ